MKTRQISLQTVDGSAKLTATFEQSICQSVTSIWEVNEQGEQYCSGRRTEIRADLFVPRANFAKARSAFDQLTRQKVELQANSLKTEGYLRSAVWTQFPDADGVDPRVIVSIVLENMEVFSA